ncbi:MAG TPA: NGG1p interacting factor NIF3 [Candidatus Goldiibacteriota bacterium]|nr:NGG1p interacting factor NIF3 [Candidatus Goldiibacteriota bacterium]
MKLRDIYEAAIECGIKNDPRGEKRVRELLKAEKENFEKLDEKGKKFFDTEKLSNPYSDSRICHDNGREIKSVMVGIDMETAEFLLAERLREKGKKLDAVITHHPVGLAYARFYEVMDMQADIFSSFGVPISAAEDLTEKRKKEVGEKILPANHFRAADAARLLDLPVLNFHTPADNSVVAYLQKRFDAEKPGTMADITDMLMEEKEYQELTKRGAGPVILCGDKSRRVKKIFVDMTGGTEGSKEIYAKLASAGVDTVVGMHFSDEHKKAIQAAGMNAVIAGHISSDDLGMNLVLDYIEKKLGPLDVIEAGGFVRVKRTAKKK